MGSVNYKKLYELQDRVLEDLKFLDNFEKEFPFIIEEINELEFHEVLE